MDVYMDNFQVVPAPLGDRLEQGGKVLLPSSVLQAVSTKRVVYPLMFKIQTYGSKTTHCGVVEFTATEGQVIMPRWMMHHLECRAGDPVQLTTVALPKGGLVKLRPREVKFTELSNPRAVLEAAMKAYSCLSVGDAIPIHYQGVVYTMEVEELLSTHGGKTKAVSVIDTDLKVDFQRPVDMPDSPIRKAPAAGGFSGFDSLKFTPQTNFAPPSLTNTPNMEPKKEDSKEDKKAFGGSTGHTLSGRPAVPLQEKKDESTQEPKPTYTAGGARTLGSSSVPSRLFQPKNDQAPPTAGGGEPAKPTYASGGGRTLGSSSVPSVEKPVVDSAPTATTGNESGNTTFQAFGGQGRKLK